MKLIKREKISSKVDLSYDTQDVNYLLRVMETLLLHINFNKISR